MDPSGHAPYRHHDVGLHRRVCIGADRAAERSVRNDTPQLIRGFRHAIPAGAHGPRSTLRRGGQPSDIRWSLERHRSVAAGGERYFGRDVAAQTAYFMEYQGGGWMDPNSNRTYRTRRTA